MHTHLERFFNKNANCHQYVYNGLESSSLPPEMEYCAADTRLCTANWKHRLVMYMFRFAIAPRSQRSMFRRCHRRKRRTIKKYCAKLSELRRPMGERTSEPVIVIKPWGFGRKFTCARWPEAANSLADHLLRYCCSKMRVMNRLTGAHKSKWSTRTAVRTRISSLITQWSWLSLRGKET